MGDRKEVPTSDGVPSTSPSIKLKIPTGENEIMDWHDKAIEALAAHVGSEAEEGEVESDDGRNSVIISIDGEEWSVFPSHEKAREYAIELVTEDLEESPELFVQDWLKGHLEMRPGDIRIYSSEAGDHYAEDMDDEEAIEQADMEDEVEDRISKEQSTYDGAVAAYHDAKGTDESDEAEEAMDEADEALDQARDEAHHMLGDTAREKVAESHAEEVSQQLEEDPLSYFEDFGMDAQQLIEKGTLVVDTESASKEAVNTDGVAHFLARYDGEEVELDGGLYAYRSN